MTSPPRRSDNFIEDYLFATSGNESPLIYHKWCCLSALSTLVGRRFWVSNGHTTYYPHLYVLLVGEAGIRKSAAMDRAKDLVRDVKGIKIAPSYTSVQAMMADMGNEKFEGRKYYTHTSGVMKGMVEEFNQYAIFPTEFVEFIGLIAPDAMIALLTGIFTEKVYDENFKNTGKSVVIGPYITLCGCLTPSTMKGFLKQSIIGGGFARRTMFVYSGRGPGVSRPIYDTAKKQAMERCIQWGRDIGQFGGEMTLSQEAWEQFDKWYMANYNAIPDRKISLQGYYSSKHDLLFKTAMLATLAIYGPERRVIDWETWEFLDRSFFLPAEEHLERVFEGAGINPNADAAAQVGRMLEALGKPMNRKKVEGLFYANAMNIKEVIDHLVAVGRLVQRTVFVNNLQMTAIGEPKCMSTLTDAEIAPMIL